MNTNTGRWTMFALAAIAATAAWSQPAANERMAALSDPRLFTLDERTIRIEKPVRAKKPPKTDPAPAEGEIGALPEANDIINTGLKIWKIIADNKPVVDVKNQYATALPRGFKGWQEMAGWNQPEGVIYELSAKNAYGMEVVRIRYQVLRDYGGTYEGKGKYLTAVTVEPLDAHVAWGYHLTMEASVPETSIVNVGPSKEDPIAAMTVKFAWKISTIVSDSQGESLYFMRGDGGYREIGGPFSNPALENAKGKVASFSARIGP